MVFDLLSANKDDLHILIKDDDADAEAAAVAIEDFESEQEMEGCFVRTVVSALPACGEMRVALKNKEMFEMQCTFLAHDAIKIASIAPNAFKLDEGQKCRSSFAARLIHASSTMASASSRSRPHGQRRDAAAQGRALTRSRSTGGGIMCCRDTMQGTCITDGAMDCSNCAEFGPCLNSVERAALRGTHSTAWPAVTTRCAVRSRPVGTLAACQTTEWHQAENALAAFRKTDSVLRRVLKCSVVGDWILGDYDIQPNISWAIGFSLSCLLVRHAGRLTTGASVTEMHVRADQEGRCLGGRFPKDYALRTR